MRRGDVRRVLSHLLIVLQGLHIACDSRTAVDPCAYRVKKIELITDTFRIRSTFPVIKEW
ncbi:hypothetical protein [Coleofasciculus sp. H7-2]|uniref:hypothetical protein n=1 Tax=Coleofasciculus sp. H7-2 TaxID=3351545 RepID=UPI00366A6AA8